MFEAAVFYVFGAVLLASALAVITARNPVHAALFLVLAFFTAAAIWLLLRAEFLALTLVVVYVGAVMVLFLFVVMMLDINLERLREGFWQYLPLGALVGVLMAAEMTAVLYGRWSGLLAPAHRPRPQQHQGARADALHRLHARLRDRRGGAAGGDHRGHRAHAAPAQGHARPGPGRAGARAPRRPRAPGVHAGGKGRVMALALSHFLVLGALLFAIAVIGIFLNRKNVIVLLMAIELMLLAVNLNFIAFSHFLGDMAGQVFVFFILTVAAAESAIGLAILVVLFRNLSSINVEDLDSLKG
jgi:NADH:ubiquinone oxidoreductase subunit 6 (subunit J)/NADH:ubiquinone oxidoreductase subunit K